jgi:hypothetical protein
VTLQTVELEVTEKPGPHLHLPWGTNVKISFRSIRSSSLR